MDELASVIARHGELRPDALAPIVDWHRVTQGELSRTVQSSADYFTDSLGADKVYLAQPSCAATAPASSPTALSSFWN